MKHNTNKDKKFRGKEMTRRNSTKVERELENVEGATREAEDKLVGGRSCLRHSAENDPSWYAQDPQLLKDAFNLSMADRLGSALTMEVPDPTVSAFPYTTTTKWFVPGIMNIELVPVPGISTDGSSAVNVAAKKLFTFIRHANSGSANYQAADLMMYMLAMDNCYTLWNWLVRLYGVARVFSTRNAYLPEGLLQTMMVDSRNISTNLCQLRTLINQFGSKLTTMKVPNHLSYFKRHAWLYSNVFADSDTAKAQLYLYNPTMLFRWQETVTSGELPYLEPVQIADPDMSTVWTIDGISSLIDSFINPIFYDEDFNIMSGDILKAYGEGGCFTVPSIQEDYAVLPVYNPEVGMQIENAKFADNSKPTDLTSWKITQSNNEAIIFNPILTGTYADLSNDFLYNFHSNEVTADMVAVATRLNLIPNQTDVTVVSGTQVKYSLASSGSEIVFGVSMWSRRIQDNTPTWWRLTVGSHPYFTSIGSAIQYAKGYLSVTQFDWAPILVVYGANSSTEAPQLLGVVGDLDNYAQISADTLVRMNDVALLSMFGIPGSAGQ
nr:MAG: putative capsid protein [Picobirnavirus sp.]